MIKTNILLFSALALLAVSSQASTVQQQHDWENQYVLAKNRMPSRSSFTPYLNTKGDRSVSLDGQWKFNWTKTPQEQPADFFKPTFDDSAWKTFSVPGDWEMNGYGTPIYSSSGYTFKIDPPYVMKEPQKLILPTQNATPLDATAVHSRYQKTGMERKYSFISELYPVHSMSM